MIYKITFAVAALLSSAVVAQYQKAPIPYSTSLSCTACIRGGWNFCDNIGGTANGTIVSSSCDERGRYPNAFLNNTDPGGVAGGWICS